VEEELKEILGIDDLDPSAQEYFEKRTAAAKRVYERMDELGKKEINDLVKKRKGEANEPDVQQRWVVRIDVVPAQIVPIDFDAECTYAEMLHMPRCCICRLGLLMNAVPAHKVPVDWMPVNLVPVHYEADILETGSLQRRHTIKSKNGPRNAGWIWGCLLAHSLVTSGQTESLWLRCKLPDNLIKCMLMI
jgi:hypothetical protein